MVNSPPNTQNATPRNIVILGAGGHGQVVADIVLRMRDSGSPVGAVMFLDDKAELAGRRVLGLEVVGPVTDAENYKDCRFVAAVGDNQKRKELFQWLFGMGCDFAVARHPAAVLAPDVTVGIGTMICPGVVFNTGTTIGRNVILNTGCTVDHHSIIGDHVHIAPGVHMGGNVTVGEGALVGIGAVVMPGKTIGAWALVGAGALVHEDVPDGAVVVGVPAHRVG